MFAVGKEGKYMPRSGTRSKKSRGRARKASPSPGEPTPTLTGNSFAALAPTDQADRPWTTRCSRTLQMRLVRSARRLDQPGQPLRRARAWQRTSMPRQAPFPATTPSASRPPLTSRSACSTAQRRRRGSWRWCCRTAGSL